jgi:hypothetical protein
MQDRYTVGAPSGVTNIAGTNYTFVLGVPPTVGGLVPTELYLYSNTNYNSQWTTYGSDPILSRTTEDEGVWSPVSQIGDPSWVEYGGKIYLYYCAGTDGSSSNGGFRIKLATATGSFSNLVANAQQPDLMKLSGRIWMSGVLDGMFPLQFRGNNGLGPTMGIEALDGPDALFRFGMNYAGGATTSTDTNRPGAWIGTRSSTNWPYAIEFYVRPSGAPGGPLALGVGTNSSVFIPLISYQKEARFTNFISMMGYREGGIYNDPVHGGLSLQYNNQGFWTNSANMTYNEPGVGVGLMGSLTNPIVFIVNVAPGGFAASTNALWVSTNGSVFIPHLQVDAGLTIPGAGTSTFDSATISNIAQVGSVKYGSAGGPQDLYGTGSPLNVVSAPVGSTFRRTDGGANTSFYVKESGGTGSTGWVGK